MKFTNLERLLPFGYLILVILGIVKESVFYYFVGINILKYSNLMDILISPISDLTSHPIVLGGFSFYVLMLYIYFIYISKKTDKKLLHKLLKTENLTEKLTEEEIKIRLGNKFLSVTAFGIMTFFLGIGIGNGKKVSNAISSNALKYNHSITFSSNKTKLVYLIGSNSANVFYVEKGNKNVKISPVGAVETIELLKVKK